MKRLAILLAAVGCLTLNAPASANDSTASMRAGGLVLERTDGIAMLSEDLYVSAREIRVKYQFRNITDQPIETIVAFPMPDITGGQDGDFGGFTTDPARLLPFITWVDDYAVHTEVEQKAVLNDVDVSGLLRQYGIPLEPQLESTAAALTAAPGAVIEALVAAGLVELSWYPGVNGVLTPEFTPLWTLKTTHYWTQYFAPGEIVEIEHLYAPAIGGSAGSMIGDPDFQNDEYDARNIETYCTDAPFIAAAARKRASGQYLSETWIDYVLITGANWAQPIGDFRLVVDKGDPNKLVSFCGDGVRQISPTQFEIRRQNFTPTRDLSVLILTGARLSD
ncbi:MAG: DUF4424 family protein [Pseudomonadota bacterium]